MKLIDKLRSDSKFFLMAGPCVIENREMIMEIAEFLKKETDKRGITYIFKASFKKANRTSLDSFTGVGLEAGLKILQEVKDRFGLPIVTDVHEVSEIAEVAKVADIIQIPAFLSRQTDLLIAAGKSGRIVNIKKAQFMAPENMGPAAAKVASTGNENILVTERGTSFGYHNLVVDFRGFAEMKTLGYPVVYDVTHSLQKPSIGTISGGTPQYVPMMARAALATGCVDGLFIETHPDPLNAKSDAKSMIALDKIPQLLDDCLKLYN